jgi:hypothetical protein
MGGPQPNTGGRTNKDNCKHWAKNWRKLYPSMVQSYLQRPDIRTAEKCDVCTDYRQVRLLFVRFEACEEREVQFCKCENRAAAVLLAHGYFPSSPVRPQIAFSLDLFEIIDGTIARGAISKQAFIGSLTMFWERRHQKPLIAMLQPFYQAYIHWCEVTTRAQAALEMFFENRTNLRLSNTRKISQLCLACLYRTIPHDMERILIMAEDGNFQHRRLRIANTQGKKYLRLTTPMFIDTRPDEYKSRWDEYNSESGCSNTFTAANKPTTFQHYHETGLLAIRCRHGIPLRYMSM